MSCITQRRTESTVPRALASPSRTLTRLTRCGLIVVGKGSGAILNADTLREA